MGDGRWEMEGPVVAVLAPSFPSLFRSSPFTLHPSPFPSPRVVAEPRTALVQRWPRDPGPRFCWGGRGDPGPRFCWGGRGPPDRALVVAGSLPADLSVIARRAVPEAGAGRAPTARRQFSPRMRTNRHEEKTRRNGRVLRDQTLDR